MMDLSVFYFNVRENRKLGQRFGQAIYNALPRELAIKVHGTSYDPYEWDEDSRCQAWLSNHLVINGNRIVDLHVGQP